MKKWLSFSAVFLAFSSNAYSQVPPDKALATMTVTDPDLELTLWASEPLFVNPTCIDIDHKGRVWVCESVNYRSKLRNQPFKRPEGDRLVVLEDTDNDGKADKAHTFYQAPDFLAPLGVAVAPEPDGKGLKVYVCHSPHIYLFEDKDGDLKADGPPKKLLTGFNGYDHDHGVHGILIGPDGKLYFSIGDTGVKDLQSSDGKGKKWTSNSTDCRAGTVWRCDLDGKNLELLAHNFRNNYEPCVDSFGTVFISDNDDDGNQQTRICYVMPGGNYGYHPRGPGQSHWHEEQPGVVPKILRTGFGSPTGMCMYEGTLLPKKYWGQPLHCDAGPRHVRCYHLTPDGAGYKADQNNIVTSTDNWFRPSDVCVAPDGSVFIADWYDPGVGGHGMGDIKMGRIYRLAPKGNKYKVPKVDVESKKGLFEALDSPALSVRHSAAEKLRTIVIDTKVDEKSEQQFLGLLEKANQDKNPILRARALHQLNEQLMVRGLNKQRQKEITHWLPMALMSGLEKASYDTDPRFRILAVRISTIAREMVQGIRPRDSKEDPLSGFEGKDPSAAVRSEILLSLRNMPIPKSNPIILELAKLYPPNDRFYLEAIGIAVGHHDQKRREIILADFDKHFPDLNEKVLDLIWELRPPSMLPLLEKKLAEKTLPAAQLGRVVDILASSDDAKAGKVLLKALQADTPKETRDRIIDNLKLFLPGKWKGLSESPELTATIKDLLEKPDTRITGLALIGAAGKRDEVPAVAALADDAKEPVAVRSAALATLSLLPGNAAIKAMGRGLEARPVSLRFDAAQALGKHASPEAVGILQKLVTAADQDLTLRQAGVAALASNRPGCIWLLEMNDKKELPDALKADVARLLRNTPYQDLRNRAMIAFPPPGKIDPKKLPSIASLLNRKGDVKRGQQLMAASAKNDMQCMKCHTIRGQGGQIGPDLSMIGKKVSKENLIESMLLPSKAIADQYLTWGIETAAGQTLQGLLIEETGDAVTLRDANGKDYKIAKKNIEARQKSMVSIMPSDLLVYMTEDDLVDMAEYLFTLKTASLSMDYWHIAGPFDNGTGDAGLDRAYPPEKGDINLKATYQGKSGSVAWKKVRPTATSYIDLQAHYGAEANHIVSYCYREIDSPADQEAVILLGTDDGGKLWVNGKEVFFTKQARAAAPEQDTVKVRLKKGKNTILLKIANGDGPHGFYFTIQAEQEMKRVE